MKGILFDCLDKLSLNQTIMPKQTQKIEINKKHTDYNQCVLCKLKI